MLLPDLDRKKSRKGQYIGWGILVLAVALFFSAKPLYHIFKRRRAAGLAEEGQALIAKQKWNEALAKLQSALQMNPDDLQANYALARLFTLSHQAEAFQFWDVVFSRRGGNAGDRVDAAKLALLLNRTDLSERYLNDALQTKPVPPEALRLASIFCDQKGDSAGAVRFARAFLQVRTNDVETELLLSRHLLRSNQASDVAEAQTNLWEILRTDTAHRANALQMLANLPTLKPEQIQELLASLAKLPQSDAAQLMRTDLEVRLKPEEKDALIAKAEQEAKGAPDRLLALCRWLSQKREYATVEKLLPVDLVVGSKDLFLVYVDAVAAMGKWTQLDALFERKPLPIEPFLVELYRARISAELKKDAACQMHWDQSLALASRNADAVRYVADYAEKLGDLNHAAAGYQMLTKDPGTARAAFDALIRVHEKMGDTAGLRDLMRTISDAYPRDDAPQNDLAYLNLLLRSDVDAARRTAERLVKEHPQQLAYRTTLALALLRTNEGESAKKAYEGITFAWADALPAWQAVYIASIGANRENDEARNLAATVPTGRLKPEELQMIRPWLATP